jgi:hypothetical protein
MASDVASADLAANGKIGVLGRYRAFRNQMRIQNGMHFVLDPGPVPNNLIAARDKPAHPFRRRVRGAAQRLARRHNAASANAHFQPGTGYRRWPDSGISLVLTDLGNPRPAP